jgi:hypothetical protein
MIVVSAVRRTVLTIEVLMLWWQVARGMRRLERQREEWRRRDRAARRARFGLRMEED